MSEAIIVHNNTKKAMELLFIIGAPILAFWMITFVSVPRVVSGHYLYDPGTPEWFIAFSAILTHAHVMMVFFRSHLNQNIFKRFPIRFIFVPFIILFAFQFSGRFVAIMGIVALYWDEWHTTLQTFGFGRIYDSRAGNDPKIGRRLDIGICFVLSLFPSLIMLTYVPEDQRTNAMVEYLALDYDLALKYGHWIHSLRWPLIAFGAIYILYYVWSYRNHIKNGYKISAGKIALLSSTCFTAVLISMFYSLADSAHYFNIYHSLQYIFIVSLSEVSNLSDQFRIPGFNKKTMILGCGFMVITIALAAAVARDLNYFSFIGGFWLLSSLLHFWYDGFIWSVRSRDIE